MRATLLRITLATACALALTPAAHAASDPRDTKTVCAYTANRIDNFRAFEQLVGRPVDCALVFNDASPVWAGWEDPWFEHHPDPDLNWAKWVAADPKRQLVITQNLFPSEVNSTDWRTAGARGDFDGHARALARNLVAHGLGRATIRLGHEANGTWYPDSIGNTQHEWDQWRQLWRHTVLAMKSVPGAAFRFDLTVSALYRPIPLDRFYPGDDVVDVVGIDVYDTHLNGSDRWAAVHDAPGGIGDVARFARAHRKPLSIPEWGVAAVGPPWYGGGDNAAFVDGIAGVVRSNVVAYQSYFHNHESATQLANGPASLAAWKRHFGIAGDSVAPAVAAPSPGPSLAIVSGPVEGATVTGASVRFAFAAARYTAVRCRLDAGPLRRCSGPGFDALTGLRPGRHGWTVRADGAQGRSLLRSRSFTVVAPRPRAAEIARATLKSATRRVRGRALLRRGGVRLTLAAPSAGRACVMVVRGWRRAVPATCRAGALASRARRFARAGRAKVVLRPGRAALRWLRSSRRRRVSVVSIVTPAGEAPAVRHARATVRGH